MSWTLGLLWGNIILGIVGLAYAWWSRKTFTDETWEEDVCSHCDDSGLVQYPGCYPTYCSCPRGPARYKEDQEEREHNGGHTLVEEAAAEQDGGCGCA